MGRTKSIYLMALSAILLLGCAILLVGATFARYQTSSTSGLSYQAKEYASVYLWSDFGVSQQSTWQAESGTDGGLSLEFCISNGTDSGDCAEDDQQVTVRLAATLGIRSEEDTVEVALQTEDGKTCLGTARQIMENTPLYASFGPGWLYTFQDEEGEELSWTLKGGALSIQSMKLSVQGVDVKDTSMLQLQVSGDASAR